MDLTEIKNNLEIDREEMIELQRQLTACPALSPFNGGKGEWKKASIIKKWLKENHLPEAKEYNAPDEKAENGLRPSLVISQKGNNPDRTVWIISHLDVVPPGDITLWDSDPWILRNDGKRIYGRGVEDNQQGMVASLFAFKKVIENKIVTPNNIAVLLVADEETGSKYGLQFLLEIHDLFHPNDIILIPDAGNEDGTMIEIAEKTILWLRITTLGRQTHASMPAGGVNAFRAGSHLIVKLDDLFSTYNSRNNLFDPPFSTFEPTMKESNVPNINTIPGKDVFSLDCRILPEENIDNIMNAILHTCEKIEKKFNVLIKVETVMKTLAAHPTSTDSPVVQMLTKAIKNVYKVEPTTIGIGGGTVANFLRLKNIPVVVWSKHAMTAHQPNEYCVIDNMIGDAKVFFLLFTS